MKTTTREKKTISGPLLECDFYPIYKSGNAVPTRAPKSKITSAEQQKYNKTTAIKKLIRLVNTNFGTDDYLMHPTYLPSFAPLTEESARKDIVNYLRRVKTKRKSLLKNKKKQLKSANKALAEMPDNAFLISAIQDLKKEIGKLSEPFRYIYVIEKQEYKTGILKGRANYHFHLFITGGINQRTLEGMWKGGIRTNVDNYQPDKFGPESAARYMSKDPQGTKRFCYSKNLIKPTEKVKDGAVSASQVEKMATQRIDDVAFWEKKYKGYRFVRCFARWNEYNGNWYVSVVMYKTNGEAPPTWSQEEWISA